jgi:hypothetical protein
MIIILIIVSGIDRPSADTENDSHSHFGSFLALPSGVISSHVSQLASAPDTLNAGEPKCKYFPYKYLYMHNCSKCV